MIHDPERVRRLLLLAAAALALVAVSGGSVVLAGSGATTPSSPAVAASTGPVATTAAPVAAQGNPFDAAIQQLVDSGTIDQAQADVLRQQVDAGSIDPQELIDSGVLTAAQMDAVDTRLGAVKRSLAPGQDTTKPSTSSATTKTPQGDANGAAGAAAHDAFDAAVEALVDEGTISQEQAGVLRQHIDAGSIDEQELIDSGVLTAAQMQAVQTRLSALKQSFAARAGSDAPSTSSSTSKTAQPDPSKTN